jgi:hypothetical protein
MYKKRSKYRVIYIITAGILLLAILLPLAGCKPEAVTTTVTEKSTVTTTLSKTETKVVTENATVTETKTVTVSPTTTTTTTTSTTTPAITTSVIANEQEQVIISADGKLKILRHELVDSYIITPYGVYVSGVIQNISSETVNAEITVDFYNIDGKYLETKTATVNNIGAGRSSKFEVWASDKERSIHPTKQYVIVGFAAVS